MTCVISQVVVEKKVMREEHKTRHEIGRERFVSKVSLNCKSGLYKLLKLSFSHLYFYLVGCLVKRFGIGKISMEEPYYNSYVVWVPLWTGPVR